MSLNAYIAVGHHDRTPPYRQALADGHIIRKEHGGKTYRFVAYFDPICRVPGMARLMVADAYSGWRICDVIARNGGIVTEGSLNNGRFSMTRGECWQLARERLDDMIARVGADEFFKKVAGAPVYPIKEGAEA